jgi:hypothetical protein
MQPHFYRIEHKKPEDTYFTSESDQLLSINKAIERVHIFRLEWFIYRIVACLSLYPPTFQEVVRFQYNKNAKEWEVEFNDLYFMQARPRYINDLLIRS